MTHYLTGYVYGSYASSGTKTIIRGIKMSKFQPVAASVLLLAATLGVTVPAFATDKYMAQIFISASTFCPRGTMETNGQLLPISQYSALFSLLGTNYGGDGRTTFRLPDMRPTNAEGEREDFETLRYCIVVEGIYPSRS